MDRMNNRDDFLEKTKRAVALRASYRCSFTGCNRITVGPSDEFNSAVSNVGKAAHICAAAPGGRRYEASMSPEQRSSIENAIWMCATHADLIDKNDVRYTVDVLHRMKADHEAQCAAEVAKQTAGVTLNEDLVAIGPDVVALCELAGVEETAWSFQVKHYVIGDLATLVAFIDRTGRPEPTDAYVLANGLSDGRVLSGAPSFTSGPNGQIIRCPVQPHFQRMNALELPADFSLSPSGDLMVKKRDIALVRGLDALPQRIRTCLSVQKGEMFFHRGFGTRLAEYYHLLIGSPWFVHFLKLEVIRQASIPRSDFCLQETIHAASVR